MVTVNCKGCGLVFEAKTKRRTYCDDCLRERRRREKAIQASNNAQIQAEALVKTLLALEEKNRADIVRGMDRRA